MNIYRTKASRKKRETRVAIMSAVILVPIVYMLLLWGNIRGVKALNKEYVIIESMEDLERYLILSDSPEFDLSKNYRLDRELDLTGLGQSIGTISQPFTGTFDGDGNSIKGLDRPLFGVIEGAVIKNLLVKESAITNPAIFYDGIEYIDGFAPLVSYATNSLLKNLGVSLGTELYPSVPRETEIEVQTREETKPEIGSPGDASPAESTATEESIQESIVTEESKEEGASAEESTAESAATEGSTAESADTEESAEESTAASESTVSEEGTSESGTGISEETIENNVEETTQEIYRDTENVSTSREASSISSNAVELMAFSSDIYPILSLVSLRQDEKPEVESETWADGSEETKANVESGYQETESGSNEAEETQNIIESSVEKGESTSETEAEEHESVGLETSRPVPETESSKGEAGKSEVRTVTAGQVVVGGLVAKLGNGSRIQDCFTNVNIGNWTDLIGESELEEMKALLENNGFLSLNKNKIGGLVGVSATGARIENSYSSGQIDCMGVITGGFVGVNQGEIEDSFTTMSVFNYGGEYRAFAAENTGRIATSFYDWQITDVEDEWSQALSTMQMVGVESLVSDGEWYRTEGVYPQIFWFLDNGNEASSLGSRISAVALMLPEGRRLSDMAPDEIDFSEQATDIDGESVQWLVADQILAGSNEGRSNPRKSSDIGGDKLDTVVASNANADRPDIGIATNANADKMEFEAVTDPDEAVIDEKQTETQELGS